MLYEILFKEDITIQRPTSGEGVLDAEGNWVTATTVTPVVMKGAVQPYTSTDIVDGRDTLPQKFGFDSQHARTVFTNALVRNVDRRTDTEPDELTVDNEVFVCWRVYNNLNSPLVDMRHCESVWLRRDVLADIEVS